ncbi:actin-histidine N-methyltransferase-like [Teleopsis dalmanni]|uniref:actin-histidine N-methyltransferase-like n=1 Tax=Teleopsis dalmanni TaxID=139649 RepID=UPI0018CD3E6F|nr:actin-histidine N-methyltransferase-like [Teleopsis dalmanni]
MELRFGRKFEVLIPDRLDWVNGTPGLEPKVISWHTDGSKTNEGVGAEIFGPNARISLALGIWPTVFQAEVHDIEVCARININKGWAVATVMTRENLIPCQPTDEDLESPPIQIAALIPFWDMANHCHGTITSFYNVETNVMDSTAQSDFKEGEQVFIHYGDRFNSDLMIHNGYVNPTHPSDGVYIKLGLSTSDPLKVARAELLAKMKLSKLNSLSVLKAPKYISPQLLAFVRIFNMNKEQLDHWSSCGRELDLLHNDCALETSLEVKTWKYLEVRLMLITRGYPTKLSEDEQKLELHKTNKTQLSHIEVMILEFLITEKRILFEALDYARQRTKT